MVWLHLRRRETQSVPPLIRSVGLRNPWRIIESWTDGFGELRVCFDFSSRKSKVCYPLQDVDECRRFVWEADANHVTAGPPFPHPAPCQPLGVAKFKKKKQHTLRAVMVPKHLPKVLESFEDIVKHPLVIVWITEHFLVLELVLTWSSFVVWPTDCPAVCHLQHGHHLRRFLHMQPHRPLSGGRHRTPAVNVLKRAVVQVKWTRLLRAWRAN